MNDIAIVGPFGITSGKALIDLVCIAQEATHAEQTWNEKIKMLKASKERLEKAALEHAVAEDMTRDAQRVADQARTKLASFLQSGVIL